MRSLTKVAALLVVPMLMASDCGNTGGKDTTTEAGNNPPVANAGSDVSQPADQVVTLDGHSSYDPDGDALSYHWSFEHLPDGSALEEREAPFARNHDATAVSTTFTPDIIGTYVIQLTVQDLHDASSAPDYVVVVAEEPENLPVADAGDDQTVVLGTTVDLDGSDSYDPQGRTLTYSWSLVDLPDSSALTSSSISNATAVQASLLPDVKGVYIANLVVNNGLADSAPEAAVITVTGENGAPTANAGEDLTASDCTDIPLDASASVDPDGDALTYYWDLQSKPAESTATVDSFSERDIAAPTFFADVAGDYVLSVAVTDGEEWSTPDLLALDVSERAYNSSPGVDAGATKTFKGGDVSCTLNGYTYDCDDCDDVSTTLGDDANVSDADGDPYVVSWSVTEGSATIHDSTSLETQVVLSDITTESLKCEATEFIFELSVTDCTGEAVTDTVTYTATCCGVEAR